MFRSVKVTGVVLLTTLAVCGTQAASAQQGQGPFPGRPSISIQAFNACTTTDYAGIIAKQLNTTPAAIRKSIVAGQNIQEIFQAAKVDVTTVLSAYQTARKADIEQALKDGVISQQEATNLENQLTPAGQGPQGQGQPGQGQQGGQPGAQQGGGPGPNQQGAQGGPGGQAGQPGQGQPGQGQPGQGQRQNIAIFPDIATFRLILAQASGQQQAPQGTPGVGGRGNNGGRGLGFALGGNVFNVVRPYVVTAQALNINCADLVKTLITPPGKAVSALAADKKVDLKTVSDTLAKAYTDALAQDVKDGILTQDQATQITPAIDKAVNTFVNNPEPMGPQGTPPANVSK